MAGPASNLSLLRKEVNQLLVRPYSFPVEERYRLIGIDLGTMPLWMGAFCLLFGLWALRNRKTLSMGVAISILGVIYLIFRPYSPLNNQLMGVALGGAAIVDALFVNGRDKSVRWKIGQTALGCAIPLLWFASSAYTDLRTEIRLSGTGLTASGRGRTLQTVVRSGFTMSESLGNDGQPSGWIIERMPWRRGDSSIVVFSSYQRYRSSNGEVITGRDLARRIVAWSGVKTRRMKTR